MSDEPKVTRLGPPPLFGENMIIKSVSLPAWKFDELRELGDGNISRGLRVALGLEDGK